MKDWAYQRIKDNILDSTYPPGVSLSPDELAQEFGISRTPIREAFLKLSEEGLIFTQPRVGTFVSKISREDVLCMFELRALLEGYGVKQLSGKLDQEDISELTGLLNDLETALQKGDQEAFVKHDVQFHDRLIASFPNPWIKKIIGQLEDLTIRERNIAKRSQENIFASLDEHRTILEALAKGESSRASKLMEDHWCAIRDRYISELGEE